MGRTLDPVCKLCRREGMKLYLKGKRCDSPKCAIDRREGELVPGKIEETTDLQEKKKLSDEYEKWMQDLGYTE